jgi:hypothetical protein
MRSRSQDRYLKAYITFAEVAFVKMEKKYSERHEIWDIALSILLANFGGSRILTGPKLALATNITEDTWR